MRKKVGPHFHFSPRAGRSGDTIFCYFVYGAACTEVEIDVLTGEREILRTDIIQDCGQRFQKYLCLGTQYDDALV